MRTTVMHPASARENGNDEGEQKPIEPTLGQLCRSRRRKRPRPSFADYKEDSKMGRAVKKKDVFAVQCFLNEKRMATAVLTKREALNFRATAQHLVKYLTKTYRLDYRKNKAARAG